MRYVTTRGQAPPTSLEWALFDGLAPDGSLYMPESIDEWSAGELASLPSRSLTEIGMRVLRRFSFVCGLITPGPVSWPRRPSGQNGPRTSLRVCATAGES